MSRTPLIATDVPLVRRLAEPVLPHAVAPAFAHLPGLALLDSSQHGPLGRFSYLSADPFLRLECRGNTCTVALRAGQEVVHGSPFALLRQLLQRYALPLAPAGPPFQGGAIGAFAYDLGRQLERLPVIAQRDVDTPDLSLGFYDWVLAHDYLTNTSWLVATGLPERSTSAAEARLADIERLLAGWHAHAKRKAAPRSGFHLASPLASNMSHSQYLQMVKRALDYIAAGDIYQVNLSQRFSAAWRGSPWVLYQRLREISPVPFGAYLDLGETVVLCGSPERFLHLRAGKVETRPIKGTRPRGQTAEQDRALAEELRSSPKDRAENVMIVDLLRNDLGRVCRIGSVRVPALWQVEGYSNVWQLVSVVTGELRPGLDGVHLLEAAFPGGSVTGCPKVRAMEIIEELEPVRRGIYCGSIGYIGFDGSLDTNIVIRTILLHRDRLYLQVGGAIVADSDPEQEYEETLVKAAAARQALAGD